MKFEAIGTPKPNFVYIFRATLSRYLSKRLLKGRAH